MLFLKEIFGKLKWHGDGFCHDFWSKMRAKIFWGCGVSFYRRLAPGLLTGHTYGVLVVWIFLWIMGKCDGD